MLQTTIDPESLKTFMDLAIALDREEMKNIATGLEKFVEEAGPEEAQAKILQDHVNSTFRGQGLNAIWQGWMKWSGSLMGTDVLIEPSCGSGGLFSS